jgi:UDP-N-acetylglucosamine--dolichyl-phosphate N-acetylglucosaminephosphotransferase
MDLVLLVPVIAGFLITLFFMPFWIRKAWKIGLVWEDMNKFKKPKVAGSGGIIVVMGFILSVLIYIAIKTFYFKSTEGVVEIFSLTTTILLLASTGLIDDLLGWHHGGLSKKFRIVTCIFASIPLIVVNAGISKMAFPFIGEVELGLLYPLFFIPLGITGAATTFNFLAGFNGLEASQGIIMLSGLGVVTYLTGNSWLSLICFVMVACLAAFWLFNKVPAKVFPGNSITYTIGGLIACIAILGNIEKIAVFFFIPYILETILKSRGRLRKQSFGKPNKDNSLKMPYDKIYGTEHLAIWFLKKIGLKATEKRVVYLINLFQIGIIILGLYIFRATIF